MFVTKDITHLFNIRIKERSHFSHSRDIRILKSSKISLRPVSPCRVQANIKNSSLLEIAIDSFPLYIVLHLFDLTSLERCHMLGNSRPMSLENASCS